MQLLDDAARLLASARRFLSAHEAARAAVLDALVPLRAGLAREQLAELPVARLRDVTGGRLRLGSLEQAGYTNVQQVLDSSPYRLQQVPGIGPQTAAQAHAAAQQIARAAAETVTVRIDVDDDDFTPLVVALHRIVACGPELPRAVRTAQHLEEELEPLLDSARIVRSRLRMFFAGRARREEAGAAVDRLEELLADPRVQAAPAEFEQFPDLRPRALRRDSAARAWRGFELDPAPYYNLLIEIAGVQPDRGAAEGFLPADIAERVNAQPLDDQHRRVSLRGYQSFGARFALVQRRVLVGDEMGLGKTIQAIAVLAHLHAQGERHFLVACPASVLVNWVREIETRSTLTPYRLHGPGRSAALNEWAEQGGVAVTTIDGLHALRVPEEVTVGIFIVDEAHYAKNPEARRSKAVAEWASRVDRVLFLTGTPMENRVDEFRNLVGYLQPDVLDRLDGAAGSKAFRHAVAPAYLRRNQEDVLNELPDLMKVDEWEDFSPTDEDAYVEAVAAGNFMAMRRAAYRHPEKSAKLERLLELVEEAATTNAKVVVFSFFRDVLAAVKSQLPPGTFGPITGSTTPKQRQEIVDDFTKARGHAVLLSQIQAGGVGLNLQAASVVILCEPQIKPTMESQAIARAHRMGQARKVQAHRLLTPNSVDDRLLDMLQTKADLFDSHARRSALAESTPEALDISEQALARDIVAAEQQRLSLPAETEPRN
jgi:superfamily II DNA or RNA helicase